MIEADDRAVLLTAARAAVLERLADAPPRASGGQWPPHLHAPGASFVTLTVSSALRGCIGTIVPSRALVLDVRHNACGAAFQDPRFTPLQSSDVDAAALEISVLGALEPVEVRSEAELIERLRPGVDGVLLRFGSERATFLPKVWEVLPDPHAFVRHLKRKMGRPDDFWDPAIGVERYTTESFGGPLSS